MTDKEKLNAIRAEVQNYIDAAHKAHTNITEGNFAHLLSFIDSLQEEPVSEDLEQAAITATNEDMQGRQIMEESNENRQLYSRIFRRGFKAGAKWGKNQAKAEIQAQSMALAHGCPKEHISEELEEAAKNVGQKYFPNEDNIWARPNYEAVKAECAFKDGAKWQKKQFEKNRLAHCNAQTEEEAQRESDFVMGIIEKEHRQPTFDDAIKYGMGLQLGLLMAR